MTDRHDQPLAELGESPVTGKPVRVLEGRFGAYVTDGETNATLPKGTDPSGLVAEEALRLLAERAARAPAKPKRKAKAPAAKAKAPTAAASTAKAKAPAKPKAPRKKAG